MIFSAVADVTRTRRPARSWEVAHPVSTRPSTTPTVSATWSPAPPHSLNEGTSLIPATVPGGVRPRSRGHPRMACRVGVGVRPRDVGTRPAVAPRSSSPLTSSLREALCYSTPNAHRGDHSAAVERGHRTWRARRARTASCASLPLTPHGSALTASRTTHAHANRRAYPHADGLKPSSKGRKLHALHYRVMTVTFRGCRSWGILHGHAFWPGKGPHSRV